MEIISSLFQLISFHTFSTTLSHRIPVCPFVVFVHTNLWDGGGATQATAGLGYHPRSKSRRSPQHDLGCAATRAYAYQSLLMHCYTLVQNVERRQHTDRHLSRPLCALLKMCFRVFSRLQRAINTRKRMFSICPLLPKTHGGGREGCICSWANDCDLPRHEIDIWMKSGVFLRPLSFT